MKRAILTVAAGKKLYWDLAVQLARSFEYWNSSSEVEFFILTDIDAQLPKGLKKTSRILAAKDSLGRGFSVKLQLDRFLPAEETLFIDADCLCVGAVESIFERFAGRPVSVVGGEISDGEWFGNVSKVCLTTGVSKLPKFNGGIYYITRGAAATAVYERARSLERRYDELGLVRLRGLPNDELVMAIAMALEGCSAIPDDGSVMGDFFACPELVELDVPLGKCILRNPPPPHPQHRSWFGHAEVRPTIVHFLGDHISKWPYRAELVKIAASMDWRMPPLVASWIGGVYAAPFQVFDRIKALGRPVAHALFGFRQIKPTIR